MVRGEVPADLRGEDRGGGAPAGDAGGFGVREQRLQRQGEEGEEEERARIEIVVVDEGMERPPAL